VETRNRDHAGETAAAHLTRRVVAAPPDEPVSEVLRRLGNERPEVVVIACAVGPGRRLLGTARTADLLAAPPETPLSRVIDADAPRVNLRDDQERVASVAVHAALDAIPVVDDEGRLEGVVPARALIEVLRREHVEDLHRLAGIRAEIPRPAGAAGPAPPRAARDRLPWLLVGTAGSAVATAVMSHYQEVLERTLAVAFFVPAIVYVADAIGTQTEAITVRAISLARLDLRTLLLRELSTGAFLGAILGGLAGAATLLAFRDARLASAVGISVVAACTVATGVGLLLPWFLDRQGRDPALGSGPLATVIQDLLSLLIYFAVVRGLLP
jgi:magnesium transporter